MYDNADELTRSLQLFYQDYLGLTPVLSVLRLMPMFVSGCLCNVVFAMVVSKLPLVVFIGKTIIEPPFLYIRDQLLTSMVSSVGHSFHGTCVCLVCSHGPISYILGVRIPIHHNRCVRSRFRVFFRHSFCFHHCIPA